MTIPLHYASVPGGRTRPVKGAPDAITWRPQITEIAPVCTKDGAMYSLAPIFGWPCENQLQWTLPTAGTLKVWVFLSSARRLLG